MHEIIIKKCISPSDKNNTNIKKNADKIKELTQVFFTKPLTYICPKGVHPK